MATPQVLDLVRVAQLLDALVEGEQATHREQHEGDDERPEVALAPVAERVLGVGRLARPACRRAAAAPGCRCRRGSGRLGQQAGRRR